MVIEIIYIVDDLAFNLVNDSLIEEEAVVQEDVSVDQVSEGELVMRNYIVLDINVIQVSYQAEHSEVQVPQMVVNVNNEVEKSVEGILEVKIAPHDNSIDQGKVIELVLAMD